MSLLRPIVPLPITNWDDMPRIYHDPYAASCNPPRQAKRLRSESIGNPPVSPAITALSVSKSPPKAVRSAAPSSLVVNPTNINTDALPSKRRGCKPSTSSRAAREAQRKINHSIIEKARRTKINDALATLRILVPAQHKKSLDRDDDDYELTDEGKGKKGEEKEFKLDVLVRTVSFLQELTEKVRILEQRSCSKCDTGWRASQKRKRGDLAETEGFEDETQCDQEDLELESGSDQNAGNEVSQAYKTRLPSIASWLPHPSVDPSNLAFTPTQSPRVVASLKNDPQPINQLPSPPASTQFLPSITTQIPPTLTLPSPSTLAYGKSMITSPQPSTISRHDPASAKTSPVLSPTRTAEDESAASMLLHISSSSYRSSSSSEHSHSGEYSPDSTGGIRRTMQPSTPSSMLGLKTDR
jgi:hypothetical protein